ncbi:MAG: hypothetical protein IJP03_05300 [Christensenellaceae bacterium]|nr:hypothetical protein [Christensenellaceae bacterium]
MRILIGSVTPWELEEAKNYGVLGLATNATVFLGLGKNWQGVVTDALKALPYGEFHMQAADDYDVEAAKKSMLEFKELIGDRMVVKLCITQEMLSLIPWCHEHGIKVNMTCITTLAQAIVAMQAGADYVSIYIGRAERAGLDAFKTIENMNAVIKNNGYDCKIVAASIKDPDHFARAAVAGAHVAAVPWEVLKKCIQHDVTDRGILKFQEEWNSLPK